MNDQAVLTIRRIAEIATPNASRYVQQLCKHFAHKRPVSHDPSAGHIAFGIGDCRLEAADATLMLSLEAPDETLMAQLQDVVVHHLVRFAYREELQFDWRPA